MSIRPLCDQFMLLGKGNEWLNPTDNKREGLNYYAHGLCRVAIYSTKFVCAMSIVSTAGAVYHAGQAVVNWYSDSPENTREHLNASKTDLKACHDQTNS